MTWCALHCRKDFQRVSLKSAGSDGEKIKRIKHMTSWFRDDNDSLYLSKVCEPQRRKGCEEQHAPAGHLWEWLSKMMIRKTQGWEKASQRKHKIIVSNKTAHLFWWCEPAGWQHQLHIKTEFAISQSSGPSAHTTVTPLFHSHRKTKCYVSAPSWHAHSSIQF